MGCFLACFGYSKKRKRRKPSRDHVSPSSRFITGKFLVFLDVCCFVQPYKHNYHLGLLQSHGSYQPLDSDVTENPIVSASEFRDKKPKEQLSSGIKKKVSFNLNVKTYEPLPRDDTTNYFSETDEGEHCDKYEETAKESVPLSLSKGNSMGSYPSNYRYLNCRDSYDEEDGIKLEESDLDDDDNDEEEDDGDSDVGDDQKMSQEELSDQFCSLSMESEKRVPSTQLGEDKMAFRAPTDQELKKLESNRNARDRSQYVHSVLNPVENLTQWKAVKSKAAPPLKHQRKENMALVQEQQIPLSSKQIVNVSSFDYKADFSQSKSLMQDIAVDASLSNWLVSVWERNHQQE
ncbi:hypothetical protein F0562_035331 [Nyssa sinensis]|uniref:Uncharacterized protein n=1 Tax=Nyssa sinensis TaxID=561372 RepID=A0A5J5AB80_9ASTE|nr:hypothetical protein F0562_035331 [Nyssa sinensis]